MALDFLDDDGARRETRGRRAHLSGAAAETGVERYYAARGYRLADRRWRGFSGEIDLIFLSEAGVTFVEVKQARTHALAAERLGRAQVLRIHGASDEYVDRVLGQPFTERAYHLALVDQSGQIEVVEDAFFVM